jgi:glutathione S-transferase
MKLFGFFRSSAAFRVRIALNLKGLAYEDAFIHLRRGDQRNARIIWRSTRKGWCRRSISMGTR